MFSTVDNNCDVKDLKTISTCFSWGRKDLDFFLISKIMWNLFVTKVFLTVPMQYPNNAIAYHVHTAFKRKQINNTCTLKYYCPDIFFYKILIRHCKKQLLKYLYVNFSVCHVRFNFVWHKIGCTVIESSRYMFWLILFLYSMSYNLVLFQNLG